MLKNVIKPQRKRAREGESKREELQKKKKTINKMSINTNLYTVTFKINGLNSSQEK